MQDLTINSPAMRKRAVSITPSGKLNTNGEIGLQKEQST